MTEIEKLKRRLLDDEKREHLMLSVTWGPRAHLATAEERAACINRALDAVEDGEFEDLDIADD